MLIIWIISSYQFAFSVQVSDACNDPQNTILQGVNVTNTNKDIDATTIDIVEYYIYCNNQYDYNPLYNYTSSAYSSLSSLNDTIYTVLGPAGQLCDITNETDILLHDYNKTLSQLLIIESALQCDEINGYLTNITNDLCVDGINYWYLLYAAQIFSILLLVIRSMCICTKSEIDYDFGPPSDNYNILPDDGSDYNRDND